MTLIASSCSKQASAPAPDDFDYVVDHFADIEVLRYQVPDFGNLSLNQKKLVYFLTEAALWGRDIMWDQNNYHNLDMHIVLSSSNLHLNKIHLHHLSLL